MSNINIIKTLGGVNAPRISYAASSGGPHAALSGSRR